MQVDHNSIAEVSVVNFAQLLTSPEQYNSQDVNDVNIEGFCFQGIVFILLESIIFPNLERSR